MSEQAKYALTWDLDSILPNPETDEFRSIIEELRSDTDKFAQRTDDLPAINGESENVASWKDILDVQQDLGSRFTEVGAFVSCHAAADAQNKTYLRYEAEISAMFPPLSQGATNVEFAVKEASSDELEALISADETLTRIRFHFEELSLNAALRLPKEQEMLAAELDVDGLHAWGRLYDRLSGELRVSIMEKGEIVEKSPGQVDFESPERTVRENNYYATNKAWEGIAETCADAINHISGTRLTKYRRLGCQDHLDVPLRFNRMSRETLNAMWSTIQDRKPMLLKYLQKKAELLGIEKLSWFDFPAPLPSASSGGGKKLTYDDACDRVIKTFHGFSPELGEFAQTAVDDRWIEVENREGKRQGGFCTDLPISKQSRIFMTFTDSIDSMSTLAHELGHAYHSFVLRDQPRLLQDYPMNLAETASTFAEAVLADEQLAAAESDAEKVTLLEKMLGDAVSFLMNIHCRFIFEDNFHRERAAGEVSAERLSELMASAQQEAYLNAIDEDGTNPLFWVSKLHFYISGWPFYNFPYTFGYLLSLGTYALAQDMGDDFPSKYRDLLIATGCMDTETAVQSTLGYDLTTPDFWNKSLDVVSDRVDQFLGLA
ncbi:MAG: oligoendopeptidase F [Planctomycetaceae bacterium]|nr:oligoendopeptidase F [Planctomycetaceae bacterium]